jgi:hypothetical protein
MFTLITALVNGNFNNGVVKINNQIIFCRKR